MAATDKTQTTLASVLKMSSNKKELTVKPEKVTFRGKIVEGTFIPFTLCITEKDVAAKTVSVTGFTLTEGRRVTVKFANENKVAGPSLNVSNTGAKPICYQGKNIPISMIKQGSVFELIYDGVSWEVLSTFNDPNEIKVPYRMCTTAGNTAEKAVTIEDYELRVGSRIAVKFSNANTAANPTFNISNTGSKAICFQGKAIAKSIIKQNSVFELIYDGTNWEVLSSLSDPNEIKIPFLTCNTSGSTAAKTITVEDYELKVGSRVAVKFTNSNTVANPSLNVSNTGAKPICYQGQNISKFIIKENSVLDLIYDGTNWEILSSLNDPNEIEIPFVTCSTAGNVAAKAVTVEDYELKVGSRISVKFTDPNTMANPTLNVSSTGAKPICYQGKNISKSTIKKNSVLDLVYDGTNWEVLSSLSDPNEVKIPYLICNTAGSAAAKTVTIEDYELLTGSRVTIKFANTNTATNPTLNISNTGAKPIYYRGYAIPAEALQANSTYDFVHNGTQWEIVGSVVWTS